MATATDIYTRAANELTELEQLFDDAFIALSSTIPDIELPDFFGVELNLPSYDTGYISETTNYSPTVAAATYVPTDIPFPDFSALMTGEFYDSELLQKLEERCRYILESSHFIVDDLGIFEGQSDLGKEVKAKEVCDTALSTRSKFAQSGFPIPTSTLTRQLGMIITAYQTARREQVNKATQSVIEKAFQLTADSLQDSVKVEELRSRFTLEYNSFYLDQYNIETEKYRQHLKVLQAQARYALSYLKLRLDQAESNEALDFTAFQKMSERYEESYRRKLQELKATYSAQEDDFNRRIEGMKTYINAYTLYLSNVMSATSAISIDNKSTTATTEPEPEPAP